MLVKKGSPSAGANLLLSTPTFLLFIWSASIGSETVLDSSQPAESDVPIRWLKSLRMRDAW
jgi:hypothetical protein